VNVENEGEDMEDRNKGLLNKHTHGMPTLRIIWIEDKDLGGSSIDRVDLKLRVHPEAIQ
jgi:hypothetical protein